MNIIIDDDGLPLDLDDLHTVIDLEHTHFKFKGQLVYGEDLAKLLGLSGTNPSTSSATQS